MKVGRKEREPAQGLDSREKNWGTSMGLPLLPLAGWVWYNTTVLREQGD